MPFNHSQALGAFSGAFAIGAVFLLTGAAKPVSMMRTLDVERINIREPDGTIRLVLSGAAQEPGIIVDGHEQPHPSRRSAGILFYNDEGTENGGLIIDGKRDAAGVVHSSGSLTFDRYKQDQLVQIIGEEDGTERLAGMMVADHPEPQFDFAQMARATKLTGPAQLEALKAAHTGSTQRAFVGRDVDGASELVLEDATGAKRLRLRVTADGEATIEFLDKDGKVARVIDAGHG
jgi:hypothetical protein